MSKLDDLQTRLDAVVIRYNVASARLAYLYANQTCLAPFPHQRAVDDARRALDDARREALDLIAERTARAYNVKPSSRK
jgi:hypothetical protein